MASIKFFLLNNRKKISKKSNLSVEQRTIEKETKDKNKCILKINYRLSNKRYGLVLSEDKLFKILLLNSEQKYLDDPEVFIGDSE